VKQSFRPIINEHMQSLIALWIASWQQTMPAINFEERRSDFIDLMANHERNGYRIEGLFQPDLRGLDELRGFIAVHPETGDLDQICVSIAAKGTSAALALLDHAKALSPKRLTLKVNAGNPRAIRFYEREGFVKTGEGVNSNSGLPIIFYRWQP
jgi:putative acetyltransferase